MEATRRSYMKLWMEHFRDTNGNKSKKKEFNDSTNFAPLFHLKTANEVATKRASLRFKFNQIYEIPNNPHLQHQTVTVLWALQPAAKLSTINRNQFANKMKI